MEAAARKLNTRFGPLTLDPPFLGYDPDVGRLSVLRPGCGENGTVYVHAAVFNFLANLMARRPDRALDVLERRRFLTYNTVRYWFTAPLFAQVVRSECLTRGQRQRLRMRAVEELAGRDDLESRVLTIELSAKVNPCQEVAEQAIAVAKEAHESGSKRTAQRALAAAERMTEKGDAQVNELVSDLRSQLNH